MRQSVASSIVRRRLGAKVLRTLCLALCLFAAVPARARETLTFGMPPFWTRAQMEQMFKPLMAYLSEETGYDFKLRVTEDYGALVDEMGSGIVDIGQLGPYGYVLARRTARVRIFLTQVLNGKPTYRGFIVTRRDSGLNTIEKLRGRSFAYTDPNSTSGFIYPRAMLVERGEDPRTYFGSTNFAGSHDVCIRGVANREVDACATWDGAFADETQASVFGGVNANDMQVIYRTDPIPNDAYVVRPGLDEAIVAQVQAAFLKLSANKAKLREVVDWRTRIDGFVVGDDAAYEVVREKVALKDVKLRLAVLPFDRKGTGLPEAATGEIAAELLASKLYDAQRFILIERTKLNDALTEQRLSLQDLVNEATAVKVGNVVGANVLLSGSVMMVDGRLHVTSRLIDTESGRILSAQHAKGEKLDDVLDDLIAQLNAEYVAKGFVLKVQDTENLTLDLGAAHGVHTGDVLRAYRAGEQLVHPVTGKVLGTEEVPVGDVVAVRTAPEMTVAKVIDSREVMLQGLRVRTLSKDEVHPVADVAGIVGGYIDDERIRYEPWFEKYAWRVSAFATVPLLLSLVRGRSQDMPLYGGIAGGLWGITGIGHLVYAAGEGDRRVPTYVTQGAAVQIGGKF